MKRRKINLNEADVFNAVLVDPMADMIRRALELGFSSKEVEHGIDMAKMHAEEEMR